MTQRIPDWALEAPKKPRRKPGPKPKAKLVQSKPKLHVKVNLSGSAEFDLEGKDAAELTGLLKGLKLDEVIEFVDPWASGAEIRYDVEVEDTASFELWEADEAAGIIELKDPWLRPRWEPF